MTKKLINKPYKKKKKDKKNNKFKLQQMQMILQKKIRNELFMK